jgi:hypothetical protein
VQKAQQKKTCLDLLSTYDRTIPYPIGLACLPHEKIIDINPKIIYIEAMKTYSLIADDNQAEIQCLFLNPESSEAEALEHLGFRVEPKVHTEEVRDFFLVDNDTGEQIHAFRDFLYENACNFALSYLGYSLFETDEDDYFGEETPENVLAFEL